MKQQDQEFYEIQKGSVQERSSWPTTTGLTEGRDYGAATPCPPGLIATEAGYMKQLGPSTHKPVGRGRPLIVNAVSV